MKEIGVGVVSVTKEEVQEMAQPRIEALAGIAATLALNTTEANVEAALKKVDEVVDSMAVVMKNIAKAFIKGITSDEQMNKALQQGLSDERKRHLQ